MNHFGEFRYLIFLSILFFISTTKKVSLLSASEYAKILPSYSMLNYPKNEISIFEQFNIFDVYFIIKNLIEFVV